MGYFFSLSRPAATVGFEVSEWMLLVFGAILVLGIFGEYKKLPSRLLRVWPHAVFEILVMIGVAGELLGDGGVFVFSSHLQSVEDQELSDMGSNAQQLEARLRSVGGKVTQVEATANLASTKSNEAEGRSGKAVENASTAMKSASSALSIARGARQEADTFEKDITLAKTQSASAESHLAEAHREALTAKRELDEYKAPREITVQQQAQIGSRIRQFAPVTNGRD